MDGFAIVVTCVFFIGAPIALYESTRAWKLAGFLGGAALIGGLLVAVFALQIRFGIIIPTAAALILYKRAQQARVMAVLDEDDVES
jgi:hypothetical protein